MDIKICSMCQKSKNIEDFNFRDKRKNIRHGHCKECQKPIRQSSYQKNRKHFIEYQKKHSPLLRKKRRQFIEDYKKDKPCIDCKNTFAPYVMDFDHLPEFTKEFQIGQRGNYHSKEKLLEEFAKCELVCANCHRIRTWKRQNINKLAVE